MSNKPVQGTGAPNQLAVWQDTNTIAGSQSLTFVNGVLTTPILRSNFVLTGNGLDSPPPAIDIKDVWNADGNGDTFIANFERHAVGPHQAAVHGIAISSWSDAWDAYGIDARVEAGTDALQGYGAQFTVISDNPSGALSGVKASLHGASDGSEIRDVFVASAQNTQRVNAFRSGPLTGDDSNGLHVGDVTGQNSAAIRTEQGAVIFGDLKQPAGGIKPVFVDTATGKLIVGE
jgi:hypothetical protein